MRIQDYRTIESPDDIDEGLRFLAGVEPRFDYARELTGPLPLRRRNEGFEALLDMIVSQQVSVAAGDAIWKRIEQSGLDKPTRVIVASDEEFRECGLSRQKIRYARALAASNIDYDELRQLPDSEIVSVLTRVTGIGRWTAEIYAMFALGRRDVIAAGDLALQESARRLFGLDKRPSESRLRTLAAPWSPWRAVAARLLWAFYRVALNREGIR
ncbi:MAG: DNA-3-methyladenine glycosylase 2 family protein [Albidovulum sp.]|nr:DNA-3-methyladenine glycosylase 2 family protein [Albidovulum sp.]